MVLLGSGGCSDPDGMKQIECQQEGFDVTGTLAWNDHTILESRHKQ